MLFQCGTLDTRQLGFPLGAERNVFRGVGNLPIGLLNLVVPHLSKVLADV